MKDVHPRDRDERSRADPNTRGDEHRPPRPRAVRAYTTVGARALVRIGDIPERQGLPVVLDGCAAALFKVEGEVIAIDDACAHCGDSLARGTQAERFVTCAGCGWAYDILAGHSRAVPDLRIDRFDVEICGDVVHVADHFTSQRKP